MWITLLLSCSGEPANVESASPISQKEGNASKSVHSQGAPHHQQGGKRPVMKGRQGGDASMTAGSGAAMQDPSGFPNFHDWPAPKGRPISAMGNWKAVQKLTDKPYGGYRPQIAYSSTGMLHVLYYDRRDQGDIIWHRRSTDGLSWMDPISLGHDKERNWGPDIVAREDGSIAVVYDHALKDFRSRGFLTQFDGQKWSAYEGLTPDDGGEIGSGHLANTVGSDLAYVFIGKKLGPQHKFQARWRWYSNGKWSKIQSFSDGKNDAWHTNVERRPDGSVLAGYDIGTGGTETTLFVVDGRNGTFSKPENITANGKPGERPHFAFAKDGTDYITWFHKERGIPKYIYVRSGKPGNWGPVQEISKGYGGFHFDPDIAINDRGVLCLIWGWDAGSDAELVYSLNVGGRWSEPKKVADINWGKPGLASIDVDKAGNFHVVWNQGVRGENEIYYAQLESPR